MITAPLDELSGLAAASSGDRLFAISDNPPAQLHSFTPNGVDLGTIAITDASVNDWEDLARGPHPDDQTAPALYIADIGDNQARRSFVRLIVVPEPTEGTTSVAPIRALTITYPDGARDAEALFVDPATGDVYVIDKQIGPRASLYRLDAAAVVAGGTHEFEPAGEVSVGALTGLVTSADIAPSGSTIAVRTYTGVWIHARAGQTSIADALATQPCRAPSPNERQGEAITFSADGGTLYSAPEGSGPQLSRITPG